MPTIDTCWSPIIWTSNLKTGCKVIAMYTVALSVILITLIIHQMTGGESIQMYSPLFEKSWERNLTRNTALWWSLIFICYFCILIISAVLMHLGLRNNIRGYLLPWLYTWGFVCFYMFLYPIWLIYTYYIYLQQIYAAIVIWIWASYNIYCWLCVCSMYRSIEKMQSPHFEYFW